MNLETFILFFSFAHCFHTCKAIKWYERKPPLQTCATAHAWMISMSACYICGKLVYCFVVLCINNRTTMDYITTFRKFKFWHILLGFHNSSRTIFKYVACHIWHMYHVLDTLAFGCRPCAKFVCVWDVVLEQILSVCVTYVVDNVKARVLQCIWNMFGFYVGIKCYEMRLW